MSYRTVAVIVEAAYLEDANLMAQGFDPEGAPDNFGLPFSANGQPPATHFGAGIQMTQATIDQVMAAKPAWAHVELDRPFIDVAVDLGLSQIEEIEA